MIVIGSDHAGIELKDKIIGYLEREHINYLDVMSGKHQENDDYPDVAKSICTEVLKNSSNLGIAICGTGIGISIACNKIRGIRAANCTDEIMAEMSKRHNNANVLALGARLKFAEKFNNVERIVDSFLNTFFEGGRHEVRLEKIKSLEGDSKYGSSI